MPYEIKDSFSFPTSRRKSITLEVIPSEELMKKSPTRPRKMTKSHIHIGDVIKAEDKMVVHQGKFSDCLINLMILKNQSLAQTLEERFEVSYATLVQLQIAQYGI